MNTIQVPVPVQSDEGKTNQQLIARQKKVVARGIESASRKVQIKLFSPEGKRSYLRSFESVQINLHYVRVIARMKLPNEVVDEAENRLFAYLAKQIEIVDHFIASASRRCGEKGIMELATYDIEPLSLQVRVLSAYENRFLDLITKVDQLMPMLETLSIDGVISSRELDIEKSRAKRTVRSVEGFARNVHAHLHNKVRDLNNGSTVAPSPKLSQQESAISLLAAGLNAPETTGEPPLTAPPQIAQIARESPSLGETEPATMEVGVEPEIAQ